MHSLTATVEPRVLKMNQNYNSILNQAHKSAANPVTGPRKGVVRFTPNRIRSIQERMRRNNTNNMNINTRNILALYNTNNMNINKNNNKMNINN